MVAIGQIYCQHHPPKGFSGSVTVQIHLILFILFTKQLGKLILKSGKINGTRSQTNSTPACVRVSQGHAVPSSYNLSSSLQFLTLYTHHKYNFKPRLRYLTADTYCMPVWVIINSFYSSTPVMGTTSDFISTLTGASGPNLNMLRPLGSFQ